MTRIEPEPPVETANAGRRQGPAWATLPPAPLEKTVDVRSAADALSFIRTTEGHLGELSHVLQRMRVLSIQSANGTYSEEDRSAIQIEVDQLTDEIARIADQADFNKMRMLTDASAETNVKAADELGMTPAKINTPASLANVQASWTLRVHVGANTNEALAVNIFAANIQHLFAGEAAAPAGQQDNAGAEGGAAVAGPVNVMTAIDANSSIAKIDVAIKAVTEQRSNLGAFQNRLESASRSANVMDARDKLLAAIGTEAEHVAEQSPGRASAALAQLADAYTLAAKNNILTQASQAMLAQANQLPQGVLQLLRSAPAGEGSESTELDGSGSADSSVQQIPVQIMVSEVPAAADARDKLLAAIGTEAQYIADTSAGQASTALAELTRAYSTVASRGAGRLSLLGFNGELSDPVTEHYLLGNGYRSFNPVLMRFISPDSLSPFGEGRLNSYAYCVGDPVNLVDTSGY
ncbi:flagellin [Streptomyces sp. NBC_00365]|uniref:flagellin N-terminal helical domain-containing protein n=1 Tax=Streptomyces sp. NBC_00365 TaxID=2975726 RepID=UPI0022537788|nr:RHS repeat-associated core domain-containing protein [Streptomyces sp. NBC_00365]MCX5097788.1 flagellin [Streptomyces sp. NBC_00365]